MGRILQVRVLVTTYAEDDVRKAWPMLYFWAFEDSRPGFPYERVGVLELVRALDDLYRFRDISPGLRDVLAKGLPQAEQGVLKLEQELAAWNPGAANAATLLIEDSLDELEKHAPKP